jgi:ADP-ribose pyrophosphatase YjhB (NUDIX family)
MLKKVLGTLWRRAPRGLRMWGVRLTQSRFTVTAGGIITDDQNRLLLLKHVFRPGSGWGIPGGFIKPNEDPSTALKRELMEEIGLKIVDLKIELARTLRHPAQVEIVFSARPEGQPTTNSVEIAELDWFDLDELPMGISEDQKQLIRRVIANKTA